MGKGGNLEALGLGAAISRPKGHPRGSVSVTCLYFLQLTAVQKNDRLSVSSTENSAIESHPQTVSQNSSFSEMT
eukprot:COSAG05_NODE_8526_length_695_cov_12.236577_1_plen_73_part_10